MSNRQNTFQGIIHGNRIELDHAPNLPDGQQVTVSVRATSSTKRLPPGEGLRQAFGGWAEDSANLEEFLEQVQRDRLDQ